MKKKILKTAFVQKALSFLGALYIKFVYATSSWRYHNRDIIESYLKAGKPFIFCFWHGKLLMMPRSWQWKNPFYMLLSAHNDGQLIGDVLSYFNINTISGSTNKKGAQAAKAMVRKLREGNIVGITPDGPRGPRHKCSEGIAVVAKLAKVDIIPITYTIKRKKVLGSWDRFHLALPFSKGAFHCAAAISHDQNVQDIVQQVENSLNNLERNT